MPSTAPEERIVVAVPSVSAKEMAVARAPGPAIRGCGQRHQRYLKRIAFSIASHVHRLPLRHEAIGRQEQQQPGSRLEAIERDTEELQYLVAGENENNEHCPGGRRSSNRDGQALSRCVVLG
jgi:hypothetical protein